MLRDEKPKKAGVLQFVYYPIDETYIKKFTADGYTISALLRQWLREKGGERYPEPAEYAKRLLEKAEKDKAKKNVKEKLDNMPNEDYATGVLKAKISADGEKAVFRNSSGQDVFLPLATIKGITIENNETAKIHNEIMNHTLVLFGGKEPTEAEYELILKGW